MKKLIAITSLSLISSLTVVTACGGIGADRWINQELLALAKDEESVDLDYYLKNDMINFDHIAACASGKSWVSSIRTNVFPHTLASNTIMAKETLIEKHTMARDWKVSKNETEYVVQSALKDFKQEMFYEYDNINYKGQKGHTIEYTLTDNGLAELVSAVDEYVDKERNIPIRVNTLASGSKKNSRVIRKQTSTTIVNGSAIEYKTIELVRGKRYSDNILVMVRFQRISYKYEALGQKPIETLNIAIGAIDMNTGEMLWNDEKNEIGSTVDEATATWSNLKPKLEKENLCSNIKSATLERLTDKIKYFEMFESWLITMGRDIKIHDTTAKDLTNLDAEMSLLTDKDPLDWKNKIDQMF